MLGFILAFLSILTIGFGIVETMCSVGMPRKSVTKSNAYGALAIGLFWVITILYLYYT
jgi:hypothetical protein